MRQHYQRTHTAPNLRFVIAGNLNVKSSGGLPSRQAAGND
jgi:hypothetical protein